jgi:flagella basal body P-ring formation protein FlgA
MHRLILILILVICSATACTAGKAPEVKVTPRAESTVQPAHTVSVRDIAQITGPAALARKVGDVTIGVGPLPGKRRSIPSSYVKMRLNASHLAAQVTGPDTFDMVGSCARWDSNAVAKAAEELVKSSLPQDGSEYETGVDKAPREMVTAGGSESELRTRLLSASARPGLNVVAVDAMLGGRVAATTSVSVQVRRIAEVLTAVTTIRQGEELTAQNTAWSRQDIARGLDAIVRPQDGTEQNWVARRAINSGSAISSVDVTSPPAVKRGDTVILVVKCGAIRLMTTAEAKQDRREGESISVRPAMSEQNVTGRVIERGLVEVVR